MRIGCVVFFSLWLAAGAAPAQPLCAPDSVSASAHGDTIAVAHAHAERNCCSQLTLVLQTHAFVAEFFEGEAEPFCHCLCCFDLRYAAHGFAPGHYTVRVWDASGSTLFGSTEVDVAGAGTTVTVGALTRGDCLAVPAHGTTWTAVRRLFR